MSCMLFRSLESLMYTVGHFNQLHPYTLYTVQLTTTGLLFLVVMLCVLEVGTFLVGANANTRGREKC